MTPKEYLKQAHHLNEWVNVHLLELQELKSLATGISSPSFGEKVQQNRNLEAPFEKYVIKISLLKDEIARDMEQLVALKGEIREVINGVAKQEERLVLH